MIKVEIRRSLPVAPPIEEVVLRLSAQDASKLLEFVGMWSETDIQRKRDEKVWRGQPYKWTPGEIRRVIGDVFTALDPFRRDFS